MLTQNFLDTLKLISQRFNENNFIWAVIGSTNLALQGVDIVPRDMDIISTMDVLPKIKSIFPKYEVAEIEERGSAISGSYWRVVIHINDIEIEVLGEKDNGIYADRLLAGQKIDVVLDGASISCLALESELQAYKETGRQNRVDLIENFLLSNK
ncbi:MAG: hypothetical protein WAW11_04745 [Patescibacteria group bacterium]